MSACKDNVYEDIENGNFDGVIPNHLNAQELIDYLDQFEASGAGKRIIKTDFLSMEEIYQRSLLELDAIESLESFNDWLIEYSDVVSVVDSTIVPRIRNTDYRKLCNREGLYASDGYIHRVLDNELIMLGKEKFTNEILDQDMNNYDLEKFMIHRYSNFNSQSLTGRIQAACPANNILESKYTKNPSGCNSDRRVTIHTATYFLTSGSFKIPKVLSEVYGDRKHAVICQWVEYKTSLHSANVFGNATYKVGGNQNSGSWSPPNKTKNDKKRMTVVNELLGNIIWWDGSSSYWINMDNAHHEGSSTGVGSNWAVGDCN